MEVTTFRFEPVPPYDFDLTASSAAYHRVQDGAAPFEDGTFGVLLDLGEHLCVASVHSTGSVDSPSLAVELTGSVLDEQAASLARRKLTRVLGIDQDLVPFSTMAQDDPVLGPLVDDLWGLHVPQAESVYEALVEAVLAQQISSHVARMLRTTLTKTYGLSLTLEGVTYRGFPRPEDLAKAEVRDLRANKFSERKAQYTLDIAERAASGELELESMQNQSDHEVIQALTAIRGVGLWTAQWILIRVLGRADGFPHTDLALLRTLGLLVNDGTSLTPEEAEEYSYRWSPYRSYATIYLFAAIRSGRFKPQPSAGVVEGTPEN